MLEVGLRGKFGSPYFSAMRSKKLLEYPNYFRATPEESHYYRHFSD
jgi:hypothetical protein